MLKNTKTDVLSEGSSQFKYSEDELTYDFILKLCRTRDFDEMKKIIEENPII